MIRAESVFAKVERCWKKFRILIAWSYMWEKMHPIRIGCSERCNEVQDLGYGSKKRVVIRM